MSHLSKSIICDSPACSCAENTVKLGRAITWDIALAKGWTSNRARGAEARHLCPEHADAGHETQRT